jgi:hypothetical protein
MYQLNLPVFDYKLKKADGKVWIFDVIRKKYVVITPEEWVRQHFIHYLITHFNYPRSLVKVEGGLIYNKLQKRSDIVVFGREGNPWMVVECKAPTLLLSENTLRQAAVYNATLKAKYLTVTNGLKYVCSATDWVQGTTLLLDELPAYDEEKI